MPVDIYPDSSLLIIVMAVWELVWKGLALYISAREDDKVWFVCLLFINSVGLLPIAYLLIRIWRKRGVELHLVGG
jgi:hypothetical protein